MLDDARMVREMNKAKAELASIRERLGVARHARRQVRDMLADACVDRDMRNQSVRSWRCANASELALLDDVNRRTAPTIVALQPQETALKSAILAMEQKMNKGRRAPPMNRGFNRGKIGDHSFPDEPPVPKGIGDRGTRPPIPPPAGGESGYPQPLRGTGMAAEREGQEMDVRQKIERPKRMKLADRILHQDAQMAERHTDYTVGPFDKACRDMDRTWGIDRLPDLVSVETAERYGSAMARFNDAIEKADAAGAAHMANVCIRGLSRMDAEARQRGHVPSPPEIWEHECEGVVYGIIRDTADWELAETARPELTIVTLRELIVSHEGFRNSDMIAAVKDTFPHANITRIVPKKLPEDEIPF